MAITFQNAFNGKANQDEYTQIVDLDAGYTTGTYPTFYRDLVTRISKTQEFTFQGLSESQAHETSTKTVTDVGGTSYSVPMVSSVTDGSTGTKTFETESVQVTRRHFSPHLWEVVVRRTGSQYYLNGTMVIAGPSWAF